MDDIIPQGKNWGITSKTAYSSRDGRKAQTLSAAACYNGFEGLIQYTYRQGHEADVHKDAGRRPQTFARQGAYENIYDLRGSAGLESDNLFRMEDCTADDCVRHKAAPTVPRLIEAGSRTEPYTAEEEAQRRRMLHPTETVFDKEYAGSGRIKPNPMDYKNGS